jgi:hypothetical protein
MAEIVAGSPRRQDQIVIGNRLRWCQHVLSLHVHTGDLSQDHRGVGLPAEHAANRRSDILDGQPGGRDLVQHRLEQVVIPLIKHRHLDRRVAQGLGSLQSTKSSPNNDRAGQALQPRPLIFWPALLLEVHCLPILLHARCLQ